MRSNTMYPNRCMSTSGHEHKYMGHETANWGGRGLGYMLFNAHLCNQPCHCQVVVEPGAQLCTLLKVWVLGVGMSTLGVQTDVRRVSGPPSTDDPET
jgi:hypothetical protein